MVNILDWLVTNSPIIILVAITAWYAYSTHKLAEIAKDQATAMSEQVKLMAKQTEHILKERERSFLINIIQQIITPAIDKLKEEITSLNEGNIYPKILGLENYGNQQRMSFYDFERRYPILAEGIKNHDNRYKSISGKIDIIKQTIYEKEGEKIKELIESYNEKAPKNLQLNIQDSNLIEEISILIIDGKGELHSSDRRYKFWAQYGDKLLAIREMKGIKEKFDAVITLIKEHLKLNTKLQDDLEKLRNDLRENYNILPQECQKPIGRWGTR